MSASLAVYILLRGLTSVPAPTIDRFNGTSWTPLPTYNAGCGNTFEALSAQMGEFVTEVPCAGLDSPSKPRTHKSSMGQ